MSKLVNQWILAVAFFGLLLTPMLLFNRPFVSADRLREYRQLAPFPTPALFWLQKFDAWFSDRFGFRDALVYYGSHLEMSVLGLPMNRKIVAGSDDWLFFDEQHDPGQPHFTDLRGEAPFAEDKLGAATNNLINIQHSLHACGIRFLFVLPPDKQTVYPEKLRGYRFKPAITRADQLFGRLRIVAPDLEVVDLRTVLRQAKTEQKYDLYRHTDTHWNGLGAFYGYRAIAQRLVRDGILPDSPRTQLANYEIGRQYLGTGDIAFNMLSLRDYFPDYDISLDSRLPGRAVRSVGDDWLFYDNPAGSTDVLLFHDSFASALAGFMAEDFHKMTSISSHMVDGEEVRRSKPNLVILEMVQRNLPLLTKPPLHLDQICQTK